MTSALLNHENGPPTAAESSRLTTLMSYLWRVVLATLAAWLVSRVLNNAIMGELLVPRPDVEGLTQVEFLLLRFISSLLITAAIAYPALLSSLRGVALVEALAVAHFGLRFLLTFVEAAVFLPQMSLLDAGNYVFGGAIESVALAICIAIALGKTSPTHERDVTAKAAEPMPWWEWLWKFVLCSFAYVTLYIVAGSLIFPFVKEYYPDLDVNVAFLIGLQLRRGVVYAACLVPLVRSMQASRWKIALATAVLVPVVHGVADLLVPNVHMAATAWRLAHMIEVGWSNFAFGLLIGFLFSRGSQAAADRHVVASDSHRLKN